MSLFNIWFSTFAWYFLLLLFTLPTFLSPSFWLHKVGFIFLLSLFILDFIYLFLERGEWGREKHRCARETLIGCFSHAPNRGPGPQPRRVPWPGIRPVTFQFEGWHPTHWATPVRVKLISLCPKMKTLLLGNEIKGMHVTDFRLRLLNCFMTFF